MFSCNTTIPLGLGTILHVEIENIRLKYKNSRIVFNFLIKMSHGNLRRCSICFILRAFIQNLRRNIIEFLELYHNLSEIFILWQVTFLSLLSMGKSKAVKWIRNLKYSKLAHSKCKLLHDNWYEIKKKVNKLDFEVTFVKILFKVHINEAKCIDISSCTTRFILQAYVWKKRLLNFFRLTQKRRSVLK